MGGTLESALPGRENAKDWLTLKIVECLSTPMTEKIAGKLSMYNSAYNAICQWGEDEKESDSKHFENTSSTLETASSLASRITNYDGTKGAHWTLDQAKQIMAERKLEYNPYLFWIALNAMYSDFYPVAKKYKLSGSLDFYVDLAKAFLGDGDSGDDKIEAYFEHILSS